MRVVALRPGGEGWPAFHGEAIRPWDRPGRASHELGEVNIRPMRIVVAAPAPDVFLPAHSSNLVISDRVRAALEPMRANYAPYPVLLDGASSSARPTHFELAAPDHGRLLKMFPTTGRLLVGPSDWLPVSEPLARIYPVTDAGFPVLRGDFFDAIAPFLDRRFFAVWEHCFGAGPG